MKTSSLPRGGFAAEAREEAEAKRLARNEAKRKAYAEKKKAGHQANGSAPVEGAKPEHGNRSGKLGTLFGHSVVRVVMALGAKGVPFESVMAGLKKHNIKAKESTVRQNLRLGKKGGKDYKGADLTTEQCADFGL